MKIFFYYVSELLFMLLYDQEVQFTVDAKKIWVFMVGYILTREMYKHCINTNLMLNMLISSPGILHE